jgi:hypothetical protein
VLSPVRLFVLSSAAFADLSQGCTELLVRLQLILQQYNRRVVDKEVLITSPQLLYPLDVVKTRQQLHTGKGGMSMTHMFRSIVATEG